jgi:hypothetical protein
MHRVFQAFIDGLAASVDADSLRTVLAEAGGALATTVAIGPRLCSRWLLRSAKV